MVQWFSDGNVTVQGEFQTIEVSIWESMLDLLPQLLSSDLSLFTHVSLPRALFQPLSPSPWSIFIGLLLMGLS